MIKQIYKIYQEPDNIDSKIAWLNFIDSIRSEESKYKYGYSILIYLEFLGLQKDDLHVLLKQDHKRIETNIISFIKSMKDNDLTFSTMNARLCAINLFYAMNDVIINKKKIARFLGEHVKKIKDRGYKRSEVKQIVENCNLKMKILVLLMASSGCRIGAIPPLKLRDLEYIEEYKLYKIIFYTGSKDEYFSFCSSECAKYINEYLEFRKRCGESLTQNSPLLRDNFQLNDIIHVKNARHINKSTLKFYLREKLIELGFRTVTPTTEDTTHQYKRYRTPIAQNHGFRKFVFTTMVNKKINAEIREMLLGHSIGLSGAYYRPTEEEILQEYLQVINDLTISDEYRLKLENEELRTKMDKEFSDLISEWKDFKKSMGWSKSYNQTSQ